MAISSTGLHAALDTAIADVKRDFGRTYPMLIDGKHVTAPKTFADESPIDTRWIIGHFQSGGREHVQQAIAAARKAYPGLERTAPGSSASPICARSRT